MWIYGSVVTLLGTFLPCILLSSTTIPFVRGECIHLEDVYLNRSVWRPEPCTECFCYDPITLCQPVQCSNPRCNFHKGEYLHIPANQCCPECAGNLDSCQYQGQTVLHNTDWSPEPCVSCYCYNGKVTCSNITCTDDRCKPGERRQSLPGQCCPTCVPDGKSCVWNGENYPDGGEWEPLPCTKCVCRDGQASCYPIQCPPLRCTQGLRPERPSGSCCPVCTGVPCQEQAVTHKDGSQWEPEPCRVCTCLSGDIVCTHKHCRSLTCKPNEVKVRRAGQCCEECIPDEDPCRDEQPLRYSGDMWNVSSCDYCGCNQGRVSCHTAGCDHVQCQQDERLVQVEGKCCPECLRPPECKFDSILYRSGDTWHPDPCTVCNCVSGESLCYQKTCSACAPGMVPVRMGGECCGQCRTVECGADCAECLPDQPSVCRSCRDEKKSVEAGRCVDSCSPGFYLQDQICSPCDDSCETCSGPGPYHCDQCPPGMLKEEGRCLPHCSTAHFLQNGQCIACDGSCSSCTGPGRDQCLSCVQPGKVVSRGQCVEQCGHQSFLSNGICHVCPGECERCLPDSPQCESCSQDTVFYKGRCLTTCPVGFFSDSQSVCRACHPSCDGCKGGADSNCTSCHGGARLSEGRCRMPCPPGQYLRMDGNCRRCVPGCRYCHVTPDGGQTRCMMCTKHQQVPVGPVCKDECGPGRYLDHDICQDCGKGCEVCDGPAVCLSCERPYVLHNAQCVQSCGQGQFISLEEGKCQDCPENCVLCESTTTCQVCDSETRLLDGQCVQRCGPGYLVEEGVCRGNQFAPVFQVLGDISVSRLGQAAVVSPDLFYISDEDTAVERLRFYVMETARNGDLVKSEWGEDRTLGVEDTFTLQDLREKRIMFTHDLDRTPQGKMKLKVSDGQLFSLTRAVSIQVRSNDPMAVISKGSFMAKVGLDTQLDSSILDVQSDTSAYPVTISVLEGPRYGKLVHRVHKAVVTQFPLDELRSGNIMYRHDDTNAASSDMMVLQLTDGYNVVNIILEAEIRDKDSKMPILVTNEMAYVQEKGLVKITEELLEARSADTGPTDQADLIFTLVPSSPENPQEGEILMVVPVPPGGVTPGWQSMKDGQMASPVFRFLQRDVEEGRIWYQNTAGKAGADSIKFEVSDMSVPPNILRGQTFHITIVPSPVAALDPPTLPPDTYLGMTVLENEVAFLGSDVLSYPDPVGSPDNIVYRVTDPLGVDEGAIEHVDSPFVMLYRFTQEDINKDYIIYRPPITELASGSRQVQFKFVVTDEEAGLRNPEQTFTIKISPVNVAAPKFSNSNPVVFVPERGYVPLGKDVLQVRDTDSDESKLELRLDTLPTKGILMKISDKNKALKQGAVVSYDDVMSNLLYYSHSGSSATDSFQVSVHDGAHSAEATVRVSVLPVDKAAPSPVPSASLRLQVTEGKKVSLRRRFLAFTDEEDSPKGIKITLTSTPAHGGLHFLGRRGRLKSGDSFTQFDVNKGRVSYKAGGEIGDHPVTESVFFNVSDTKNNVLPNQALTIIVNPSNDQAPVVTVKQGIQVEEGGQQKLTSHDISVSDQDSKVSQLSIILDAPPTYGAIQSNKPALGSELNLQKVVKSFPLQDLLDGHIYYVQSDHKNIEAIQDSFLFHATDGVNNSPSQSFSISVIAVNDEPPEIITEQLFVQEDKSVSLTNATFFVIDLDSRPDELVFTVDSPPSHGSLGSKELADDLAHSAVTLRKGSQFTYEDVLNELIVYRHNGEEVTTDSFSLTLTDGRFTVTKTISVVIGLVNDETPRLVVNHGLRLPAGSTRAIKSVDLRATDIDSDDEQITYTLTHNPTVGTLRLNKGGRTSDLSVEASHVFTQADVDKGYLEYVHQRGDAAGSVVFKFQLSDPEGNTLLAQSFYITVLEDRVLPSVDTNKPLILSEGSQAKITTQFLSASDKDSEPGNLLFSVLSNPLYGHLELSSGPGVPVTEFHQSDLAANSLIYVHTSEEEIYADRFKFSVSDGTNEVTQAFQININPVDDSLPMVSINGLRVQEGVRKVISEFDLKAIDKDTKEDHVMFTIVQTPLHGSIDLKRGKFYSPTSRFSMADIYENLVSYKHDGSETLSDQFSFTVSDGTNHLFVMQQDAARRGDIPIPLISQPQSFKIEVLPLDDGSPILETNLGLQFLESYGEEIFNIISERELKVSDVDTPPDKILFVITAPPKHGRLVKMTELDEPITTFTQDDISKGLIRYTLTSSSNITMDSFTFEVMDSKPNIIPDNTFHVSWSVIEFGQPYLNVTEETGVIQVPVIRRGNLKQGSALSPFPGNLSVSNFYFVTLVQYSIITCRTLVGTATSTRGGNKPGLYDFVEQSGQVQFDEWQESKPCTLIINDDHVFEGPETLYLELSDPTYTLLGSLAKMTITIFDLEDEPVLQFDKGLYQVNESDGYVLATLTREGDLSSSVSVICYTQSLTATGSSVGGLESGSDFQARGKTNSYRVVFPPGVVKASCEVKLIDDSEFENSEEFELGLVDPSLPAAIGTMSKVTIIIEGPNDESVVYLSQPEYRFPENGGNVEIEVLREGSDLAHSTMVWCATRLSDTPSATPGQDYVPSSSQITFGPGQISETCRLTILDDNVDPHMEGNETFVVFLSSAMGSSLAEPFTSTVIIHDSELDIPVMGFEGDQYYVDEKNGTLGVPIIRQGDLSFRSSVICYTRQETAAVMMDYEERLQSEASRITFYPGQMVKNCTVKIVDDGEFEPEETLTLNLADPQGTELSQAKVGTKNKTSIVITNYQDVPTIQFEKAAYSVMEPNGEEEVATVQFKVIRSGDINQTSSVRCSTRDGSAVSGIDYNPKSLLLKFSPGMRSIDFSVDVLYNREIEWHESFSVILGPNDPEGAVFGPIRSSTVTILDNEVSGSLVLPAAPIVVSLLHYDDVEKGLKLQPSPGYPLVCVTPCDLHYPDYSSTHSLCEEAGVNQSSMYYRWEVSMPEGEGGARPPFVTVSDNTLFTSVNRLNLDSIYFRPSFKVRCVAQPLHGNGNPGVPLKSQVVTIGRDNAICPSTVFSGQLYGYQAQSFIANLDYVGPEDEVHPNTIHISVQVPHQDGMLPLISTHPLHNLRFLLSDPTYRQQHVCSNIVTEQERAPLIDEGFLSSPDDLDLIHGPGYNLPYQFDGEIREDSSLNLYKHLDLKSCIWTFNAWYHMTELVDVCGGQVISDFQVRDSAQTYLTVRLPLYVSYLYATAPTGWGSLEHRTQMEFSFFYNTILWRTGLETDGKLGGKLQVLRILIGDEGKLIVDFKTQAKFRGLYVPSHHTLQGFVSRVLPPGNMDITFDLELLWSQQTFDSPQQLWRATSDYNLKDYTGQYVIELIPCSVKSTQAYTDIQPTIPCTAHQPERFEVPIAFQQTNRPVPVVYSLNTEFQLTNNEKMFLLDPQETHLTLDDLDYSGAFSKGQKIYGRVLWSPEQDLKTAYKLVIEKLYLCTGRDGYVPTFDPTGEVYNEGPQFGCIQPHPDLKYRFLILDRENPDVIQTNFNNVDFGAQLAGQNPDYAVLEAMPGVDGFVMNVDPLYKVDSGHQWYLQCLYTIGVSDRATRVRRSAILRWRRDARQGEQPNWLDSSQLKNGTNIQIIQLNITDFDSSEASAQDVAQLVAPAVTGFALASLIVCCCCLCCVRRRRRKRHLEESKKSNLVLAEQNPMRVDNRRNSVREKSRVLTELDVTNVTNNPTKRKSSIGAKNVNVRVSLKGEKPGVTGPGTEV